MLADSWQLRLRRMVRKMRNNPLMMMMEHCHLELNNPILWQSDQPTVGDGCFLHFLSSPSWPQLRIWLKLLCALSPRILPLDFSCAWRYSNCSRDLFLVEYSLNTVNNVRFETSNGIFKKSVACSSLFLKLLLLFILFRKANRILNWSRHETCKKD